MNGNNDIVVVIEQECYEKKHKKTSKKHSKKSKKSPKKSKKSPAKSSKKSKGVTSTPILVAKRSVTPKKDEKKSKVATPKKDEKKSKPSTPKKEDKKSKVATKNDTKKTFIAKAAKAA